MRTYKSKFPIGSAIFWLFLASLPFWINGSSFNSLSVIQIIFVIIWPIGMIGGFIEQYRRNQVIITFDANEFDWNGLVYENKEILDFIIDDKKIYVQTSRSSNFKITKNEFSEADCDAIINEFLRIKSENKI